MAILDSNGRPVRIGCYAPGPSRDSGAFHGAIANWRPRSLTSPQSEAAERIITQKRAADLYANDWAARSGVRTIADNAIGTGLMPKAVIPHAILGISREQAAKIGDLMEWAFSDWSLTAHANGFCRFEDLQYLGIVSILRQGEMLHLPVMLPESGRPFALAIQNLDPLRLATPVDMQSNPYLRDGVEIDETGKPIAYWLNCPPPQTGMSLSCFTTSAYFTRRPALAGKRRNIFHLFRVEEDEQYRGRSAVSCSMELYRSLNDCFRSELFAQVIAASFPLFIELENGSLQLPDAVAETMGYSQNGAPGRVQEVEPGTIIYGSAGEKPKVLESNRPSANFAAFETTIKRAMAASLGVPYESLSKDYSKTNYSSMRAALNEAWKVYGFYRAWFGRSYCQPIWEMLIEEAYLRNYLGLADAIDQSGSKLNFYEGLRYWTSASWIGPARGFVDPVKEINATILALQNRLMTYSEAWAERGGDFGDSLPVMREELAQMAGIMPKGLLLEDPSGETEND